MKKQLFPIFFLISFSLFFLSIASFDTPIESITTKNTVPTNDLVTTLNPESYDNETLLAHNMNVRIQSDDSIKITSTFVLVNNDSVSLNSFLFQINRTITSVFCFDPLGPLDFTWQVNPADGNLIDVSFRYPVFPDELYIFSVSYLVESVIYHVDGAVDYYGLDYEVIHPRNSEIFNLEICLPIYANLLTESPPDPVFPQADSVTKENNVVKINWQLNNRNMNESDIFLIRFEATPVNPNGDSPLKPLFYTLSVLGGIIIGGVGVFLFYRFKTKPAEKQLVTSLLTDTEQEVIKAINSDSGVSTQRRICEKTGFSKSKVSQILAKLEEKKVLKRERWGRTNKVTITNQSFKQLGENVTKASTPES